MKKQKSLAIALGGGSALGFAHIGFLQVLDEEGIKVTSVAGTSMGALIGAFYAKGYSGKELEDIALNKIYISNFVFDLRPITFIKDGLISGRRIENAFNKFFENKNIEELPINYCAVAVDLYSGNPYIFKKGNLAKAVRTSISIPSVFKPVKLEDKLLVDGGIIDNVPANYAKELGGDVVVAVDVLSEHKLKKPPKTITGLLMASFNVMQKEYVKLKPSVANLKIDMDVEGILATSFDKKSIKKAIKIGREYAKKHLEEIKSLIY